ncbi:hypothetical protein [Gemmata sp.]|uniref:hypothetical protein n=1 Tax=Gemmata sp. TaxID=1914242 RepID=UPI003F6F3832
MSKATRPTTMDRPHSFVPDCPATAAPRPDEMEALIQRGLRLEAHAPGRACPPRPAAAAGPVLPEGDAGREFDADGCWW